MSKRADQARALTTGALERYAAEKLAPDDIVAAATKAAGQGFSRVRIAFDRPLDLRDSKAAAQLVARLSAEGYRTRWEARRVLAKDSMTGADEDTFDLDVSW